jgi:peptide deformylase
MANRTVLHYPDKRLREVAQPVQDFEGLSSSGLVGDLIDTLEVQGGLGLAATQVGEHWQVLVVKPGVLGLDNPDPLSSDREGYLVLCNPQVEPVECEAIRWKEACLSVPGAAGTVERSSKCRVAYQRPDGTASSLELDWPLAGVVQHEIDHLSGHLYLDRLGNLERRAVIKRLEKVTKAQAAAAKKRANVGSVRAAMSGQLSAAGQKAKPQRRANKKM